jgi:heat shock protein HtpX
VADQITENKRRAFLIVGLLCAVADVVLGLLGFVVLDFLGLVLGLVIGGALVLLAVRQAPARVARQVGGQPADETAQPRLHNVLEGLCVASGVPKPALLVLDDAAPNVLTYGRSQRDAVIVTTSGLLDKLSRIELEGVMAHELSHIKSLDILPDTLAAAFNASGVGWLGPQPRREALADLQAVGMTRYPPGLLSALEKLQADQTPMAARPASIAHLWLKPPETGRRSAPQATALDERIEARKVL